MLQRIVNNKTQAKFAEHLKSSLEELSAGMTVILDIVRDHINSFTPYNPAVNVFINGFKSFFIRKYQGIFYFQSNLTDIESGLNSKNKKCLKGENERNKNKFWFNKNPKNIKKCDNDNVEDKEYNRRINSFSKTTGRLKTSQFELLSAYKETRSQFVWGQKVRVLAIKKRMSESNLSTLINNEFKRVNSNKDFAVISNDTVLEHMSRNLQVEVEVGEEDFKGNVLSHNTENDVNFDHIYNDNNNDNGNGNDNRLGCYDTCLDGEGRERGGGGGEREGHVGDVQSRKRSISGVSIGQINEIIESLERNRVTSAALNNKMNSDRLGISGNDERTNDITHSGGRGDRDKEQSVETDSPSGEDEDMLAEAAAAVHAESLLLSWKNLAPRGAYLHRISILSEIFTTFDNVLLAREHNPFSIFSFIRRNILVVFWYILDCIRIVVENFCFFIGILSNYGIQRTHTSGDKQRCLWISELPSNLVISSLIVFMLQYLKHLMESRFKTFPTLLLL